MKFERFDVEGPLLVLPTKHGDRRGFFSETFRDDEFATQGLDLSFVQDNHVYSGARGVLRGLHYQVPPHAQGKLVRCTRGRILDVGVDIRMGSPTFGRHVAVQLSALNWKQLWLPTGFAHGYVTLEPDCEVIYKVTDYYAKDCEQGIAWDDPSLSIDWRLPSADIVLSDKDRENPRLNGIVSPFHFGET